MAISQSNTINKNFVTVGAATATLNNNVLNTTAGAGAIDTMALPYGGYFKTLQVQLTCSAILTAGQVFFEGSNDNVNFSSIYATEMAYEWTGLTYDTAVYPFAGTNAIARTFKFSIDGFRYIRVRISTALVSGTITANSMYSQVPFQPTKGIIVANRLQNASLSGINAASTVVNGAGNNLRIYFVKATIADGGASANKDVWVAYCASGTNTTPTPSDIKFGSFSSSTTSPESGDVTVPYPLPAPVNTGIGLYLNAGTNIWTTIWYFIAP